MSKPFPVAALFDFDGVIVDSREVHHKAWSGAFKMLFSSEMGPFPESLVGKTPLQIAECFCLQGGDVSRTHELYDLKEKILKEGALLANLHSGVKSLFSFLKQNGIPYGIASNATRGYLKKNIEGLGIDVDVYTGFEDYEKPKPAPEPYVKLAKKLGVKKSYFPHVWVFEDSIPGLSAAIKANMFVVGVKTQYSTDKLRKAGADWVINRLDEALSVLVSENCI